MPFENLDRSREGGLRELLEADKSRVPCREVRDCIPIVLKAEKKRVLEELQDSNYSIVFDATPRSDETFGIIIRFLNSRSYQLCIRTLAVKLYRYSFDTGALVRTLLMTLTQDYRLDLSKCRFMIAGGCAVNAAAVEKLTAIMPTGIFVVCVPHASNLVGSVFEDSCKLASSFLKSWSQMLTKSYISVILFKQYAGTSTVKTENHVRWYSWWEVANQIATNFQACEEVLNDDRDF